MSARLGRTSDDRRAVMASEAGRSLSPWKSASNPHGNTGGDNHSDGGSGVGRYFSASKGDIVANVCEEEPLLRDEVFQQRILLEGLNNVAQHRIRIAWSNEGFAMDVLDTLTI